MTRDNKRQRRVLLQVIDWWDNDANRLRVIKSVFWIMFLGSISGTLYAWSKGSLPAWAISAYVTFATTLVFATFSYAIKYTGELEKQSFLYSIRSDQIEQWRFERDVLLEFARYCACDTFGHPWSEADNLLRGSVRSTVRRGGWPRVDAADVLRKDIRSCLNPGAPVNAPPLGAALELDLVAYSSETFIELSREIVGEIEVARRVDGFDGPVHVRVLTRDTSDESDWLVPLTREQRRDGEYRDELSIRFTNVRKSALGEFEDSLKDVLSPDQVEFQVKGYRLEPLLKGILVNHQKGVFGLYSIDDLRSPKGWDYSGHAVAMCRADIEGKGFESLAGRFLAEWFDGVWSDNHRAHVLQYRD